MAAIMAKPHPTLPPNHKPPGGVPYRVKNGDHWESVARAHGMEAGSLIFFNFGTHEPKYINYYLKHSVGCTTLSPDGKNYSFWNASPGIIYLPTSASNFHYIAEPVSPIERFDVFKNPKFQLEQHPTISAKLRCRGYFEVSIKFKTTVPDVTRYVYRQFIRGRVRVRSTSSAIWHDHTPIQVPAHHLGTPHNVTSLTPIDPTLWREDGEFVGSIQKRYGYREVGPELMDPIDMYSDPLVTTRPATPGAVWQTGYAYRCTDYPGIQEMDKVFTNRTGHPESINGLSVDLEFKGEIWDWRDLEKKAVLQFKTWRFDGHFEIPSRAPLIFNRIARPA